MEAINELLNFINENTNYGLLAVILFGGIFFTKYGKFIKISDVYKVLIGSTVVSAIFYFVDKCGSECLPEYLFTYLFATSLYEVVFKKFFEAIGIQTKKIGNPTGGFPRKSEIGNPTGGFPRKDGQ